MQKISFAAGHFLEWTFTFLEGMGWMPVVITSVVLFVGMLYWLGLQARDNKRAKATNTLA